MINRHVFVLYAFLLSEAVKLVANILTVVPPLWQLALLTTQIHRCSVGLHCSRIEAVVEMVWLFHYVSLLSMEVVEKSSTSTHL